MPKTRIPYEDLPFLSGVIAETVCSEVYTGQEISDRARDSALVARTEAKRLLMTPAEVREFSEICDRRCKAAYSVNARWFMKCAQANGNAGRDQLYVWLRHWLCSYLNDPRTLRRDS